MVITGRFFVLVLVGAIPTVLFPHYWVVLVWVVACVVLLLIDLAVVGNPTRTLELHRVPCVADQTAESTVGQVAHQQRRLGGLAQLNRTAWHSV